MKGDHMETDDTKTTPQEKGGHARAKALSPKERSDIATEAAYARWSSKVPRATHTGELHIGDTKIPCAVLEDGTRVLTQWGFLRAIGRSGRPAAGRGSDVEKVAPFLAVDTLKPYISKELADSTKPMVFRIPRGIKAFGYKAELLPKVCEVYLQARDDKALLASQEKFAKACDALMRGLAHVGIVALVDEATGYEEVRDRQALQAILDKFLRHEFAAWAKRFPDEFYNEIFRLKDWTWEKVGQKRPQVVAKYTKDLVYARLGPGILRELEQRNPRNERGYRKAKHHQWLTADIGHPRLAEHIYGLIGLMRACDTWTEFMKKVNRAYPKKGDQLQLDLI